MFYEVGMLDQFVVANKCVEVGILSYYGDLEKHYATKKKSKEWHEVMRELEILKSTPATEALAHSDP